ncbi:type I phosphodiesterase/nucleotide pyrophosphatase [Isosphaera pallida ATCC 43644]|uniref:Type I phosphodiesterase/nucleotide pyrophosphatase n=1 Tax=Isosphaera pallida (strain ATCC 43644 / DSM 9630 / IS1B) TaxID=575540 RepID=E8R519_ISOPI|nr:alkaline phosphatase family protein [Isosphaera pallida]ADV62776.1 type I phosphodiesterase/nucleotide pyrophosphatase [Isosphaera pallida ATCC 43644]
MSGNDEQSGTHRRVVILGLDGATWTVLEPWIERGAMPNLAGWLRTAARGVLRSVEPPVTSAAWTSMSTGARPGRHGVFDHRWYDPAGGRMRVNHSRRVRVETLWETIHRHGGISISLNLPGTYPAPAVRGLIVSGMDAPHLEGALSGCPPEFAQALKTECPDYSLKVIWKRPPQSLDELRARAEETRKLFRARAEGGLLADRFRPDWSALMVQFQNLDPFQHRVWRHLNVDETGLDDPALNQAAGSVLTALDEAVGLLLELAERRGAAVAMVSDHGFGPCLGRIAVNAILRDAGIIRFPGAGRRAVQRLARPVDLARLWLAKRRDPQARAASFDTSIPAQYPFDWNRTLGFAPHQDTAAMIYLNTSARKVAGVTQSPLNTPRQIDQALADITGALSAARHPETGASLFPVIRSIAEVYNLDPSAEGFPDLVALPDPNYWVRSKLGGDDLAWVRPDPNLPGTHRMEGIVALGGFGLDPSERLEANLIDVAPTLLTYLNLPLPSTIEGRSLVKPPAATSRTVVRTDPPREGMIPPPHRVEPTSPSFDHSDDDQALIEQRLRDLGYLD